MSQRINSSKKNYWVNYLPIKFRNNQNDKYKYKSKIKFFQIIEEIF